MFKKLTAVTLMTCFVSSFAMGSEKISSVAASKQMMQKVSNYVKVLKEKRSTQSVEEILAEKAAVIDNNINKMAQTGELSAAQIQELRESVKAEQLGRYEGIEDASVLAEIELAEIQSSMTSENFVFLFTRINLAWYAESFTGGCYGPYGTQAGCILLTVLSTPFAIVGDVIMLPFALVGSAVTGF